MKRNFLKLIPLILALTLLTLVSCVPETVESVVNQEVTESGQNSTLEIQFIDVGQADAALILCNGKTMLIDGGNRGDSNVIYTVLKNRDISSLKASGILMIPRLI